MILRSLTGGGRVAIALASIVVAAAACSLSPFIGPDPCSPATVRSLPADMAEVWVGVQAGETPNDDAIVAATETGVIAEIVSADAEVGDFSVSQVAAGTSLDDSFVMFTARCGGGLPRDTGAAQLHVVDIRTGESQQLTSTADRHIPGAWSRSGGGDGDAATSSASDDTRYAFMRTELHAGRQLLVLEPPLFDPTIERVARDLVLGETVGWTMAGDAVVANVSDDRRREVVTVDIASGEVSLVATGVGLGVLTGDRVLINDLDGSLFIVELTDGSQRPVAEVPPQSDVVAAVGDEGRAVIYAAVTADALVTELRRLTFDAAITVDEPIRLPDELQGAALAPVLWPVSDRLVVDHDGELIVIDPGASADAPGAVIMRLPFASSRGVALIVPPR